MKLKKKLLIALGVVVIVAFISGASILAASTFGTSSDPLVTLSYLTNKLKPQILEEVNTNLDSVEATLSAELDAKISGFKADIESQSGGSSGGTADTFSLVTLSQNQTIQCGVGTELLLRVGTASAAGSSPALVDTTSGTSLNAGGAVEENHMYMVSIQGNGLKATSATVKLLLRGTYTVS